MNNNLFKTSTHSLKSSYKSVNGKVNTAEGFEKTIFASSRLVRLPVSPSMSLNSPLLLENFVEVLRCSLSVRGSFRRSIGEICITIRRRRYLRHLPRARTIEFKRAVVLRHFVQNFLSPFARFEYGGFVFAGNFRGKGTRGRYRFRCCCCCRVAAAAGGGISSFSTIFPPLSS